jgi:L-asparaginase II
VVLIFLAAVVISTFLEPLRLPLRPLTSLAISEAGVAVKYNIYLREKAIELRFQSTDRSRVELAARLLKLAGVGAEVKSHIRLH